MPATVFGSEPPTSQVMEQPIYLVALGTSLTAMSRWPKLVCERLAACRGRPVELAVFARPGANSSWGLTQLASIGAIGPDILLVEFAANDAALHRGLRMSESEANLRRIISTVRRSNAGAEIAIISTNPVRGLRGWVRPWLRDYFAINRKVATDLKVQCINVEATWLARPNIALDIPDGLHPDEAVATRIMSQAILNVLCPRR